MDIAPNAPATRADSQCAFARLGREMQNAFAQLCSEARCRHEELKAEIRDSGTRLLNVFYSIAEPSQQRLAALERESAALKSRLTTVESCLTEVEKRLNIPPAA